MRRTAVLTALLVGAALLPERPTDGAGVASQRSLDAGTTAAYAPGDPLLFGPTPQRFGRPTTITVYRNGRLAEGWRDLSAAAHALTAAPPAGWLGRAMRVDVTPGAGLYLRAPAPLDSRGGGYVQVVLNGGAAGGQQLALALTYDGGKRGTAIPLTGLLQGAVRPKAWVTVLMPVQNTVPAGARVDGVSLQEIAGRREPALYIGAITLRTVPLTGRATDSVQFTASVDATAGHRAISPYIYGLAGDAGDAYLRALRPTLMRWGGDPSTRYNWRIGHAWNAGRDYYYRNGDYGIHSGSASDAFIARATSASAQTLLTIPTIGWVAKDTTSFSFPGKHGEPTDGRGSSCTDPLAKADPRRTSVRVGPVDMQAWARHLEQEHADVRFFAMDNEPDLWGSTHYDVHPTCTSYDEIYREFTTYASAIKDVAPHSMVTGPVSCCWQTYFHSALDDIDRQRHDNLGFLPWFLQSVHAYDQRHQRRTLDVLDIHYYPEGVYNTNMDAVTAAWRLQETRSLWDPTYVDHSWINQPVQLIPRMDSLISYYYPGTRLGISEWNWGSESSMDGALALADVLGIYGRQGLYMAAYWHHPAAGTPAALAFQMFRNYDGRGAAFGETSVRATSSNGNRLSVYASRRHDGHLLVMLINKMPMTSATTDLGLRGFSGRATHVYRLDATAPHTIAQLGTMTLQDRTRLSLPPYSLTLLDVAPR